jgi:hypothetical protein
MPNINVPHLKHRMPYVSGADTWEPYTDIVKLVQVQAAVFTVIARSIGNQGVLTSCNAAFAALPGGRDFSAIFNDPDVWISYNSNPQAGLFGTHAAAPFNKEITIAAYVFTLPNPIAILAATIVHELAHVNGAPGWPSPAAESTLPPCGFGAEYDPGILGLLKSAKRNRLA